MVTSVTSQTDSATTNKTKFIIAGCVLALGATGGALGAGLFGGSSTSIADDDGSSSYAIQDVACDHYSFPTGVEGGDDDGCSDNSAFALFSLSDPNCTLRCKEG